MAADWKYPKEVRTWQVDFAPHLGAGDSVASISEVSAIPPGELILTPVLAGNAINLGIAAGVGGHSYTIMTYVLTAAGKELGIKHPFEVRGHGDGRLALLDDPALGGITDESGTTVLQN